MVKIKKEIQVCQVAKMSPLKNKNTFSLLLFHSLHVQVMNYFLFSFIIYGLLEKFKLILSKLQDIWVENVSEVLYPTWKIR